MIELDVSEIRKLEEDLATTAVAQMKKATRNVTAKEIKEVQDRAKSLAPRERPWLATQGIRRKTMDVREGVLGIVYTVADPENRPVGFFVEFGTSKMAPQSFMGPATTPSEQTYPERILASLDPLATSSGGGAGGDGGDDA